MGLCFSSGTDRAEARSLEAAAAPQTADVVVIGAGMSGIAAAQRLAQKGMRVTVVEGRTRLGGRLWTRELKIGGKSVNTDLGASWIHGIKGNPLVGLAQRYGVALASHTTDYDNDVLYKGATGKEVPDSQSKKWDATFSDFEDYVEERQGEVEDADGADPGLASVVAAFIAKKKLSGENLTAFKYLLNVNIEHEYAAPISELSLFYDYDSDIEGDDKMVTGGYANIVKGMAKGLSINYGMTVTKVDYSNPSKVVVTCAGGMQFVAKSVVVTLPLGVLKSGKVAFVPALPAANTAALKALNSGLLNKCLLVFPRVFWDTDVDLIERIGTAEGAFQETLSMIPVNKQPILIGFNAAAYATSLEKRTDAETVAEMMAGLRKVYKNVPDPTTAIVTRWGQDPFSLGSYSYTARNNIGFKRAHRDVGKPVANRVFFAGEHTSVGSPATVHGAYQSGIDAACALLKVANKQC